MLKPTPVSIAILAATLFGLLPDPVLSGGANYVYLKNSEEQRLGVVYKFGGDVYNGELAVDLQTKEYLFVQCGSRQVRRGKEHMQRYLFNCGGSIAPWDRDGFPPVDHEEPDVGPCKSGPCLPSPYDFHIPDLGQPGWSGGGYGPGFDPGAMPGIPVPGGAPPGGGMPGGGFGR